MELYISGCKECPLYYDDTDGQQRAICHHAKAPTVMGIWESGIFTHLPFFELPVGLYKLETEKGTYSLNLKREPLQIETTNINEEQTPITPEWCPLKVEPITISLKKED